MTRFVWVALVFVGMATLTTAAVLHGLERWDQPYKTVDLEPLRQLTELLSAIETNGSGDYRIIFLGDSLSVGPGGFMNAQQWVPTHLASIVKARTRHQNAVEVVPLLGSGRSVFSYYYMSDRIVDLDPDDVIVQFNLFWLSESWHQNLDRTVLAALLPFSRWREAITLPLYVSSLTTDRWILYRSLSELGLLDMWYRVRREQVRMPDAFWNLYEWAQQFLAKQEGLDFREVHQLLAQKRRVDERGRATQHSAQSLFGRALDGIGEDHFALAMLDALLGRFEDAGVSALVYVPPHNVENLERLGLLDREGIDRSLARIEAVVRGRGGRFIDLHDLFPDQAFRDYLDHYVDEPGKPGARLIARELVPNVFHNYQLRQRGGR